MASTTHNGASSLALHQRLGGLVPLAACLTYPFWLNGFHAQINSGGAFGHLLAGLCLAGAFAVPAVGFLYAWRRADAVPMRRLAYATVVAPTLYVFLGVVTYMVKAKIPDETLWIALWLGIGGIALFSPKPPERPDAPPVAAWRVVHGITAVVIAAYVLFHVSNHLFFWAGEARYNAVQSLGEGIYRQSWLEPLLVVLLLMQCVTGMRLFWRWSARRGDFIRTLQLATGIYLLVYITGHMDSVFVFSRSYLSSPSDWAFATGAPAGMLHDAWNIRLLPHYFLGVFLVLTHLACGARGIALAHGLSRKVANIGWTAATLASLAIATTIMLGMAF